MLTLLYRLKGDEALMQAYQRGDAGAFECLYHRHKDGLFAFLYRSCPRREIVEELAQESWAAVVDKAPGYRPDASFKTWLYRIGRNKLIDFWRRRDNNHQPLENAQALVDEQVQAEDNDTEQRLMAAIGELPLEQRDTLLLQEQGFKLLDIAIITDTGEETVKSRLRYARRQLREQLGDLL